MSTLKTISTGKGGTVFFLSLLLMVGSAYTLHAQNLSRVNGSDCVGDENTFVYNRFGCTVTWNVGGTNYTIVSTTSNSIKVKWNSAQTGAYVRANYSCSSSPTSGSEISSSFEVIGFTAGISPAGSTKVCFACPQTYSATPTGTGYSYTWLHNGAFVSGGSSSTYLASQAGTYSVIVARNFCTKTSALATLVKNVKPIVSAGVDKSIVFPITSTSVTGSGSDPDGTVASYEWSKISGGTATLSGQTTTTLSLSNLYVGSYTFQLKVTDNTGDFTTDDVIVVVEPPPNNYNYIKTTSMSVARKTETEVAGLAIGPKNVVYQYVDGLGRPNQTVNVKATPSSQDMVQPVVYDAFGRESISHLPFSSGNTGYYKTSFVGAGLSGYAVAGNPQYNLYQSTAKVASDTKPYAETRFEASPLNRPIEQGSPGLAWQPDATNAYTSTDRTIKKAYEYNSASEVLKWTYTYPTTTYPLGLVNAGTASAPVYHAANKLTKNKTKDEQGNEVIEYLNGKGKVVLKRVQAVSGTPAVDNTNYASTYYIYDHFDNLVCVLPPEASRVLTTEYYHATATNTTKNTFLDKWAFRYAYDTKRRMVEKKVPGSAVVYMVYDNRDRVVLTQDGNLRSSNQWMFTKYDILNRPILTGIKDSTVSRDNMQLGLNNFYALKPWAQWGEKFVGGVSNSLHGYTNKSFPVITNTTADELSYLTATYYDSYSFMSSWGSQYNYLTDGLSLVVGSETYTQPATGAQNQIVSNQVTGTKIKVLDGGKTGGSTFLKTVNYYDDKYRVIQVVADNYKGGEDRSSTLYDFSGKVLKNKTTHIERDVTWKDFVGVKQIGNMLKKTTTLAGGASSVQALPAGVDGWMEVIFNNEAATRWIGFNDVSPDPGTNINYAFKFVGSTVTVVEGNSAARATVTNARPGDIFKIQRTGTVIKFYYNGSELTLSPNVPASATSLLVDCSMNSLNSTLIGVRASFGSIPTEISRRFEYDHAGRVVNVYHSIGASEVRIVNNEYNEIGQLVDKKLHSISGSTPRQSVDYRYNIRGWLTSMNNASLTADAGATNDENTDYFGMSLSYNFVDTDLANAQLFNGNISGMKWSNYPGTGLVKQKGYTYTYDPLNRIQSSAYREKNTSWTALTNSGFAESGFTYDLNGNIKTLTRNDKRGSGMMDNLTYNYGTKGNQLESVSDAGDATMGFADGNTAGADYTYDVNGNMTVDKNKGITVAITYNYLNLPEVINRGENTIQYIYDASGRKLAQVTDYKGVQKQTDYTGEFQYENDALQHISHEEGRVVLTKNENIFFHHADGFADVSGSAVTLASHTLPNGEKYVKATASSVTARAGITSIGSPVVVSAGERYRVRIKGYRDKGTHTASNPVHLSLKGNGVDITWPGATLPAASTTESWTEQIITIPSGVTQLTIGLNWNTTLGAGEAIYFNELEVIKETSQAPEYQYNLKDHLGNVRLTFTSKDETESALATMETANAGAESGKFLYYDEAIKVNYGHFDHTYDGTTGPTYYATRLTGGATNAKFGLARSISVMPGDVINAEVYAKYVDTNTANWQSAFSTFMGSIAGGTAPAGTVVDGGSAGSLGGGTYPITTINHSSESGTAPKAYLNYLVFNKDMLTVLDAGYVRITTASREYGQNVAHEKLEKQLTITEPGYVYIYLSNENATAVEVYFDDFEVEHVKSPVVQVDDYYAFGLMFNSYSRETTSSQDYKYNGKELQDELNLGWLDYGARMYMPEIGRWGVVDPLGEKYMPISPYAYALNNPVMFVDHDGREVIPAVTIDYSYVTRSLSSVHDLGSTFVKSFAYTQRSDGNYDVKVNIAISMNNGFAGGPSNSNNPNSSFNRENPGLHNQVMAHEKGHAEQFKQVIQQGGYQYNVDGKQVTGKLDQVSSSFLKSINKQVKALNKQGFSSKQALADAQKAISAKVAAFNQSMADQIDQKMDKTFGGETGVENHANKTSASELKKNGEGTNYISGETPIKENGKAVPKD
jgi:RHS repeat-associated protein